MTASLRYAAIALAVLAALQAYGAWLFGQGFAPVSIWHDWGIVELYAAGKGSFGDFVSAYPQAAATLATVLGLAAKFAGLAPPPGFAAFCVAAALFVFWAAAFRSAGYGMLSWVLALLLAAHPYFLYSAAAGVDAVLLLAAVYWLASAFCASRATGHLIDFMSLALALAFAVSVHVYGVLLCLLLLPFLPVSLPASLRGQPTPSVLLVLLFPTLFCLASFAYLSFVMRGDASAYLLDLWRHMGLFHIEPGHARGWERQFVALASWSVFLLLLALPAALALLLARRDSPAALPMAALIGWAVLAACAVAMLASRSGGLGLGGRLEISVPFLGLAAVAIRHWSPQRGRGVLATLLLAAGAAGGWAGLLLQNGGELAQWRDAVLQRRAEPAAETSSTVFGRYLADLSDVLIDVRADPALLVSRGSAAGLIVSGERAFKQTLECRCFTARFVAIADPNGAGHGVDDLNRAFPLLYRAGIAGYHSIYDANGWRVYERNEEPKGD